MSLTAGTRLGPYGILAGYDYDVTGDGQRFLVVTRVVEREVPPIAVVVNGMAGLKGR